MLLSALSLVAVLMASYVPALEASPLTLNDAKLAILKERNVTLPRCPVNVNPRIRREWRTLSKQDQDKFIQAVLKMQQPGPDGTSEYQRFVDMYAAGWPYIAGKQLALVWTRWFLSLFEQALLKQGAGPLPYWQFTKDAKDPTKSEVWSDDAFGGNGDPASTVSIPVNGTKVTMNCITSGKFKDYQPMFDGTKGCIARTWKFDQKPQQKWRAANWIDIDIRNGYTYAQFAKRALTTASTVQFSIGGLAITPWAAADPLFLLFLANVDLTYLKWQMQWAGAYQRRYDGVRDDGTMVSKDDILPVFTPRVIVKDTFEWLELCYTYDENDGKDAGFMYWEFLNATLQGKYEVIEDPYADPDVKKEEPPKGVDLGQLGGNTANTTSLSNATSSVASSNGSNATGNSTA